MNAQVTTELVCRMALNFKERGSVTMTELLEQSGYLAIHAAITENDLSQYFRHHSDLIETWLSESGNKRTSTGWYIKEPGGFTNTKLWVVGYYPNGETRQFCEAPEACGFYVKMEAEAIRKGAEQGRSAAHPQSRCAVY